jgi:hypothetical protein
MTKNKDQNAATRASDEPSSQPTTTKVIQTDMDNLADSDIDAPAVDRRIQGIIGRQLRAHYDGLVGNKVPDNLLKLLDDLAKSEQSPKKDK